MVGDEGEETKARTRSGKIVGRSWNLNLSGWEDNDLVLCPGLERTTAGVNTSVRTLEEFRRGVMVVKIKVVEVQWLNSQYAPQID